jgi:hypothetical protein
MTHILKFVNSLDGFLGGPGANVMYFTQGTPPMTDDAACQDAYDMMHAMYSALAAHFANGVKIIVGREATIIDVVTGETQGVAVVETPLSDIVSTATPTGEARSLSICARTQTNHFQNSKRLTGRVFLGPISSSALQSNGQYRSDVTTQVEEAFVGMHSGIGARLAVYHRPPKAMPGTGYYADVTGVYANTVPSNINSRLR